MMCQEGKQFTAVFLVLNTFLGSTLVFRKFLLSKTFRRRQYNLPLSWKFKLGSYVWTKQVLNISVSSLWSTWIFVAAIYPIQSMTRPHMKNEQSVLFAAAKKNSYLSSPWKLKWKYEVYSKVSNSIQLQI